MRRTKEELLKHYADRNPQPFIQFDCFVDEDGSDDMMKPDSDGDCLFSGTTYELMTGAYGVRVLIKPDLTKETAARALSKIIGWITKKHEDVLKDGARQLKKDFLLHTSTEDQNKKRRNELAQLILDNGFTSEDFNDLRGKAFARNQDGSVKELNLNDPAIDLDCSYHEDAPF